MSEQQPKPHPHAHWIKLWADGIPIEHKSGTGRWVDVINFSIMTMPDIEYRIKPSNDPWKPEEGGTYLYVNSCGEVYEKVWESSKIDEKHYENGNCFHLQDDAEATAERVKKAMKGTTDVSTNVGSNVGSKDEEIKALKDELEKLKLKISAPNRTNFQLDGKPLTEGEIALIRELRNVNIYEVYEGDSLLVFNDEDDGLQVDGNAVAFDSVGRNDEIRACLKKIKKEQELNNETQKQR